ncbi:MAG: citrate (Si)-synthase, partial [Xanthomonadales bacterium]|nr:citrate (Si)-synthase [Xanthomonadales bacterium]
MSNTVAFTDSRTGKTAEMPLVEGVLGDPAIDIAKLNKDLGLFTFDPGFVSTCSTKSAITYIDGDQGILL